MCDSRRYGLRVIVYLFQARTTLPTTRACSVAAVADGVERIQRRDAAKRAVHRELWPDLIHQPLVALQPGFHPRVQILRRIIPGAIRRGRKNACAAPLGELNYIRAEVNRRAIHHHDAVRHRIRLEVRQDAPPHEPLKLAGIRSPRVAITTRAQDSPVQDPVDGHDGNHRVALPADVHVPVRTPRASPVTLELTHRVVLRNAALVREDHLFDGVQRVVLPPEQDAFPLAVVRAERVNLSTRQSHFLQSLAEDRRGDVHALEVNQSLLQLVQELRGVVHHHPHEQLQSFAGQSPVSAPSARPPREKHARSETSEDVADGALLRARGEQVHGDELHGAVQHEVLQHHEPCHLIAPLGTAHFGARDARRPESDETHPIVRNRRDFPRFLGKMKQVFCARENRENRERKKLVSFSGSSVETENQNVWKPVRAEHPESANRRFHFSFFIFRENRPRRTELELAVLDRSILQVLLIYSTRR